MSKQNKAIEDQRGKKNGLQHKSDTISEPAGAFAEMDELPSEILNANSSTESQVARLNNSRLQSAQRQAYATQIEQVHGNQYLQRLIANFQRPSQSGKATRSMLQESKSESETQIRQQVEQVTGYDLSRAEIHPYSPLPASTGAEALTIGSDIHLAPAVSQPRSLNGEHVLAHEFAHVVQQATGQTTDIDRGERYENLEARAEQVARYARTVDPAGGVRRNLPRYNRPVIQAFDPAYHREALVKGLEDKGFSHKEVGQMYAANWERDFSQGHPALANIVLTWKQVKMAAREGRPMQAEINTFEDSIDTVISMVPQRVLELVKGESYGGYRFFEHMDNPDYSAAMKTKLATGVTIGTGVQIPQYMVDSREYIKAQLFQAAQAHRGDLNAEGGAGKVAAAFDKRRQELEQDRKAEMERQEKEEAPGTKERPNTSIIAKETAFQVDNTLVAQPNTNGRQPVAHLPTEGLAFNAEVDRRFWERTHYKVGQRLDPNLDEDKKYVQLWLSVRDEVRMERQAQEGTTDPSQNSLNALPANPTTIPNPTNALNVTNALRPDIPNQFVPNLSHSSNGNPSKTSSAGKWTDHMGRASHALEDFFAHSNFVELAIPVLGETDLATGTPEQGKKDLATGTFDTNDKIHALAHKIRAMADEIQNEPMLVERATERTQATPDPSDVHVGADESPEDRSDAEGSGWEALGTGLQAGARLWGGAFGGAVAGASIGGLIGTLGGPIGQLVGTLGGGIIGGALGLRVGLKSAARDVIATPRGAKMLRHLAEILEDRTRSNAKPGSHTKMAKDQPGHDGTDPHEVSKTVKFKLAHDLAIAADGMILGAMRPVLDAATPEAADAGLQAIYQTLDQMIAPFTDAHPLKEVVNDHKAEAEKTLQDQRKSSR
jgi:hypothetical protein